MTYGDVKSLTLRERLIFLQFLKKEIEETEKALSK